MAEGVAKHPSFEEVRTPPKRAPARRGIKVAEASPRHATDPLLEGYWFDCPDGSRAFVPRL